MKEAGKIFSVLSDEMKTFATLTIRDLTKSFDKQHFANNHISLEIENAKITAFLGHNGAGKSTLLNQMIGFTKPDQGDVCYGGISFVQNRKRSRSMMGYMSQQYAPLEKLTVEQNIEMLGRMRGLNTLDLQKEMDQLLTELEIKEYRAKQGKDLSGGLKRLTSFAMALIGSPTIILLDEPTNDVDPIRREKQWQLLQKLAHKGHTIIIVTHNLLEVEKYADNYALFNHGKLIKSGPVQQITYQKQYQIFFEFRNKDSLDLFQDYTIINGSICQIEIEEKRLTRLLPKITQELDRKNIFNLSLAQKNMSISDLYREELTN
mgnify:FL=1